MTRYLASSMRIIFILFLILLLPFTAESSSRRQVLNFDLDWQLYVGDLPVSTFKNLKSTKTVEGAQTVSLPRAFNGEEAFSHSSHEHTDTVMWYYKTFKLPSGARDSKVFIEFEGVRQAADVYLNGQYIGCHENGVMAFGMDLTPHLKRGDNLIAVRVDNDWQYRERGHKYSRYQWNDRNFNANYGGIPKHVKLHLCDDVYQTLPLYSNLGTTGVYVYATDIDCAGRTAVIHSESEVRNDGSRPTTVAYEVELLDADGKQKMLVRGESQTIAPDGVVTLSAESKVSDLHFWSHGYGYLYTVRTRLIRDGKVTDEVVTRTGFRKTRFAEGKIWLNDRVMMMKGYAQRTSNEWPAVGMSVPAWMSDYSNRLMVESGANLVRWMHVTPWKQDVESCDRVGLIQAMPAGDSERDVDGRRWEQRVALMRDAIIYNRNNPSVIFYECGNKGISEAHFLEMKALRDKYDPHGGRAIGSREMLDIDSSEYGGEMLYINKSKKHPMWAMEYCRDEGMRRYWDNWTFPYHRHGDGPLYKGADATAYNQNQDMFAVEHVRRWHEYWLERPGTGKRTSGGGVKIIFSDTNTHSRGESNYRTSGVVDAMRLPKESFYVHQVMWNGWVDNEEERTHIVGHWNYSPQTVKPVYVVSTAPEVRLWLNGKLLDEGRREYAFLHTFDNVAFEPGVLVATGHDFGGRLLSSDTLQTVGEAVALRLTLDKAPDGFKADGADMVMVTVEAVDEKGRLCPTDFRMVNFTLDGQGEYLGGIAGNRPDDLPGTPKNYILSSRLPLECGTNRILIRSTRMAGDLLLRATADGLPVAELKWQSIPVEAKNGYNTMFASEALPLNLTNGETPATVSYEDTKVSVEIVKAETGANKETATNSFDDNERSEWTNDGRLSTAWITYTLEKPSIVDEVCMKLTGWRMRRYPIEIYADTVRVWEGDTPISLGYVHLPLRPVEASTITIRLKGSAKKDDAFSSITELAAPVDGELDLYKSPDADKKKNELRIVEVDFLRWLVPHTDDGLPIKKIRKIFIP